MTAFVFVGPTISVQDARSILDAVYLPPVRQGDVWRVAAFCQPSVIAIIDGFFEHVPAVWHKEILWALSQGIPVCGAASMGAIRAAELEQFGMIGIGRIFAAYRDQVLPPYSGELFEDDDEVAVVHGPPESGYPSSEAMVNIRCTLAKAEEQGVISQSVRDRLVQLAKSLFYKDRSFANLLTLASDQTDWTGELDCLRAWLPTGRVDQKREDAMVLLRHLKSGQVSGPSVPFHFEHTTMWDQVPLSATSDPSEAMVLTELRLQGTRYIEACRQVEDNLGGFLNAAAEGLDDPVAGKDPEVVAAHVRDKARLQAEYSRIELIVAPLVDALVLNDLRTSGEYDRLLVRAKAKQKRLSGLGRFPPDLDDADATPEELMAWFCARSGGNNGAHASAYATRLGFEDMLSFLRALVGEYIYVHSE